MSEIELKRDIAALQREVANLKSQIGKSPVRIPIGGSGVSSVKWAVIKNIGVNDNYAECRLLDDVDKEIYGVIYVYANIFPRSAPQILSYCFPRVNIGDPYAVIKKNRKWYFIAPFVAFTFCVT
jgi:hypothetical protein